ncbi:MAG: hypothetical protein KDN05_20080, partial [Verrucomicrobiae bacterium]|nr:hypothetical protein [Verrucomicrobiae bacterium]
MGAPASTDVSVANAHWVGVWNSWKGENRYLADSNSPSDLVPDLSEHREDSFRRWLVSAEDPEEMAKLGVAESAVSGDSVTLVGSGTLGDGSADTDEVNAALVPMERSGPGGRISRGAFAWWVGDESQKGQIREGRGEEDLGSPAEAIAETDASSSVGEELFEQLNGVSKDENLGRATISLNTLGLVDGADNPGSGFHDLTVAARSVLTDVREGGLKRDLNLLAESYDANFDVAKGLPLTEEFMLYQFDDLHRVPLHDLLTYYTLYKALPAGSKGALTADGRSKPSTSSIAAGEVTKNKNGLTTNLYRQPVMVKTQLAIWARADRSGTSRLRPYRLKFRFSPIVTLWNPYNVPLTINGNGGNGMRIDVLGISADMAVWPKYERGKDGGRESSSLGGLTSGKGDEGNSSEVLASMIIKDEVEFAPGEVLVFSLDKTYDNLAQVRELKPGYWPISGNEVDYYDIRVSRGGAVGADYDDDSVTFTPSQLIGVGFAGGTEDTVKTTLKFSQGVSIEARPDYKIGSETSWRTQALYSRRATEKTPSPQVTSEMNQFNQLVFELGSQLDGEEMKWRTGNGKYIRQPYSIRNLASAEGEVVGIFTYGVAGEE